MKIDIAQPIRDLENTPIEGVTFRTVACLALTNSLPGDERLTDNQKLTMFALALRIQKDFMPLDFKIEELALIKERIGRGFSVVVVGRCYEIIEAADKPAPSPFEGESEESQLMRGVEPNENLTD